MIQAYYIYFAVYFYCYDINSTSDHRHSIPEVGHACPTVESLIFHFFKKEKNRNLKV